MFCSYALNFRRQWRWWVRLRGDHSPTHPLLYVYGVVHKLERQHHLEAPFSKYDVCFVHHFLPEWHISLVQVFSVSIMTYYNISYIFAVITKTSVWCFLFWPGVICGYHWAFFLRPSMRSMTWKPVSVSFIWENEYNYHISSLKIMSQYVKCTVAQRNSCLHLVLGCKKNRLLLQFGMEK